MINQSDAAVEHSLEESPPRNPPLNPPSVERLETRCDTFRSPKPRNPTNLVLGSSERGSRNPTTSSLLLRRSFRIRGRAREALREGDLEEDTTRSLGTAVGRS